MVIWKKKFYLGKKHTGKTQWEHFGTFETSLMVLSIASVKLYVTKLCVFKSILPKIIRLPPMCNINDSTKFEDNQSKQSGLRVHTSFKNGWRPSWKQDGRCKFFKTDQENLKMIS